MSEVYRYMVIGAHQDDCELMAGTCLKLMKLGHKVKFLTATNGCSGHQVNPGAAMVQRRMEEARRVSELSGVEYEMLDNDDGSLTTGLPERWSVLKAIRQWKPDFIFTHRPNDYHPDHRNTSILVQDCSYLVQVPNVCPTVPVLRYQPIIAYMPDNFTRPYPFTPTMVFDIDDVIEDKMRMYHQYTSQFYEWLPWVEGKLDQVPPEESGEEARFQWLLENNRTSRYAAFADKWRQMLDEKYPGRSTKYAEAFELCEYGGGPGTPREKLEKMFPF